MKYLLFAFTLLLLSCNNNANEKKIAAEKKRIADSAILAQRAAFVQDSTAKATMSTKEYESYLADKGIEKLGYTVSDVKLNGFFKTDLPIIKLWKSVDKSQGYESEIVTINNTAKITRQAVNKSDPSVVYYYVTAKKFGDKGWILKDWVVVE